MFSIITRPLCTQATKSATTNNYHYVGKWALLFGSAAMSSAYSAILTEEGRNFASSYIKSCFSGESSHVVSGNDLDGS